MDLQRRQPLVARPSSLARASSICWFKQPFQMVAFVTGLGFFFGRAPGNIRAKRSKSKGQGHFKGFSIVTPANIHLPPSTVINRDPLLTPDVQALIESQICVSSTDMQLQVPFCKGYSSFPNHLSDLPFFQPTMSRGRSAFSAKQSPLGSNQLLVQVQCDLPQVGINVFVQGAILPIGRMFSWVLGNQVQEFQVCNQW